MEYHKILENILGRKEYLVVGQSVVRADALDKALGLARYTSDYIQENTVVLKVVRSTEPHALIKNLNMEAAKKITGVLDVITGADVPGENQIGYALPDQPFLCNKKVHFAGAPIAIVCAETEEAAEAGRDAVSVDYERLPTNFSVDDSLVDGAYKIHEGGNIALTTKIRKGNIKEGFSIQK